MPGLCFYESFSGHCKELLKRTLSLGTQCERSLRAYSHQAKVWTKAKMIKEWMTNIKEHFYFCFHFHSVWMDLKSFVQFISQNKKSMSEQSLWWFNLTSHKLNSAKMIFLTSYRTKEQKTPETHQISNFKFSEYFDVQSDLMWVKSHLA